MIGLRAGVPWPVPARTVARNCASGMEAVTSAVAEIQAGRGSAYLCLGVEVMSAYPLIVGRKMTAMFAKLMGARSLPARPANAALPPQPPPHLRPRRSPNRSSPSPRRDVGGMAAARPTCNTARSSSQDAGRARVRESWARA